MSDSIGTGTVSDIGSDLRALCLSLVALVAGISTAGCRKPTHLRIGDFPTSVGPPFGFDRLPSGANRLVAILLLNRLEIVEIDDLHATGRWNERDEVTLYFDHLSVSHIVLHNAPCDLGEELSLRWSPTAHVGSETTWGGASDDWIASWSDGRQCGVMFFDARSLPRNISAPTVVARLRPGMTRQTARQLAPGIADSTRAVPLDAIPESRVAVEYDAHSGLVTGVFVLLPPWVADVLEARWGAGTSSNRTYTMWHDRETRVRARAFANDHGVVRRIDFDTYVPWRQWLGAGAEIAALGHGVLGATRDELARVYGTALRNDEPVERSDRQPVESWLAVAPMELSPPEDARVDLSFDADDRVRSMTFSLWYDSREMRAEMLAALESKWGPRTESASGWGIRLRSLTVRIDDWQDGAFFVSLARP